MHKAGATALAVDAGRTLLLDREAMLARANELQIAIFRLRAGGLIARLFALVADQERQQVFLGGGMRPNGCPICERIVDIFNQDARICRGPRFCIIVIRLETRLLQFNECRRNSFQVESERQVRVCSTRATYLAQSNSRLLSSSCARIFVPTPIVPRMSRSNFARPPE